MFTNEAPTTAVALEDVSGDATLNLTEYFVDANPEQTLTYSVAVSDPNVVNATLEGPILRVRNGLFRDGTATVTVTASDGISNVTDAFDATYTFTVTLQFTSEYVYEFENPFRPASFTTMSADTTFVNERHVFDVDGAPATLRVSRRAGGRTDFPNTGRTPRFEIHHDVTDTVYELWGTNLRTRSGEDVAVHVFGGSVGDLGDDLFRVLHERVHVVSRERGQHHPRARRFHDVRTT